MSGVKKEDASGKVPRQFVAGLLSALNGMTCPLEEPWKTHFNSLKDQYNSILESLPPSDMVPAASEANWNLGTLLSCLTSAQNLVNGLGMAMNGMKTKMDDTLASLNGKVEAALADKIKGGDLVAKETVTALCSEAKNAGFEEGKKEAQKTIEAQAAAAKVLTDRRALVSTNGLPVPEKDELLAGTEEQFTAAQAKAKSRMEALKGKGIALNSKLMPKVWLADAEFASLEALVAEAMAERKGGGEPFATTPGTTTEVKAPRGIF